MIYKKKPLQPTPNVRAGLWRIFQLSTSWIQWKFHFWYLKLIKISGYNKQNSKLFNNSIKIIINVKQESHKSVVPPKFILSVYYSGLFVSIARVLVLATIHNSENYFDRAERIIIFVAPFLGCLEHAALKSFLRDRAPYCAI